MFCCSKKPIEIVAQNLRLFKLEDKRNGKMRLKPDIVLVGKTGSAYFGILFTLTLLSFSSQFTYPIAIISNFKITKNPQCQ